MHRRFSYYHRRGGAEDVGQQRERDEERGGVHQHTQGDLGGASKEGGRLCACPTANASNPMLRQTDDIGAAAGLEFDDSADILDEETTLTIVCTDPHPQDYG